MGRRTCGLALVLLAACANGLKLTAALTRRAAVLTALAPLSVPLASHAIKETGYAANLDKFADSSATRRLADTPLGAPAGVRIGGTYSDPNHPGCKRKVTLAGSAAIIDGSDEDGKAWRVKGEVRGKYVLIDFSPKGGPTDVIAEWNGLGLAFPDGNVWVKK
jgi:hypothetical protein